MRTRSLIQLLVVAVLCLSACRFKAPTGGEGQELKTRGAFPTNIPAWVNQNRDDNPSLSKSSGIIPEHYTAPPATITTIESINESEGTPGSRAEKAKAEKARLEKERSAGADETLGAQEDQTVNSVDPEDKSPIGRIEALCPGTESSVSEALRTENIDQRVLKYKALTDKCPDSSQLWVWLGKDYESRGELADAVRAYERALIADPSDRDAAGRLASVRDRINNPGKK